LWRRHSFVCPSWVLRLLPFDLFHPPPMSGKNPPPHEFSISPFPYCQYEFRLPTRTITHTRPLLLIECQSLLIVSQVVVFFPRNFIVLFFQFCPVPTPLLFSPKRLVSPPPPVPLDFRVPPFPFRFFFFFFLVARSPDFFPPATTFDLLAVCGCVLSPELSNLPFAAIFVTSSMHWDLVSVGCCFWAAPPRLFAPSLFYKTKWAWRAHTAVCFVSFPVSPKCF